LSGFDDEIYRDELLDHYYSSPRRGRLEQPDVAFEDENPLCGDRVRVEVKLANGTIEDIRFDGDGCVISQASASLLCEKAVGKRVEEVNRWGVKEVLQFLGIQLTPVRLRCALLPLKVLQVALAIPEKKGWSSAESPRSDSDEPRCAH